jgi:hypothetical protein
VRDQTPRGRRRQLIHAPPPHDRAPARAPGHGAGVRGGELGDGPARSCSGSVGDSRDRGVSRGPRNVRRPDAGQDPRVRQVGRGVTVKRAAKNQYCLQSTLRGPVVHYDGPRGPVRRGPCGVRGAVVAQPQPKQTPPAPADAAATAQSRLRAAVPAIEAYAADNGGYAGLTLAKIHAWDYGVQVSVAWAKRSEYCIQSTVGTATYHLRGPAHPPAAGRCPAAT